MLPLDERHRLDHAIRDAFYCALDGFPLAGRELLDFQLIWAETPPLHPWTLEPEPPDPWADELAQLCRRVLMDYSDLCDQLAALPLSATGTKARRSRILRWRAQYLRSRSDDAKGHARETRRRIDQGRSGRRLVTAAFPVR